MIQLTGLFFLIITHSLQFPEIIYFDSFILINQYFNLYCGLLDGNYRLNKVNLIKFNGLKSAQGEFYKVKSTPIVSEKLLFWLNLSGCNYKKCPFKNVRFSFMLNDCYLEKDSESKFFLNFYFQ